MFPLLKKYRLHGLKFIHGNFNWKLSLKVKFKYYAIVVRLSLHPLCFCLCVCVCTRAPFLHRDLHAKVACSHQTCFSKITVAVQISSQQRHWRMAYWGSYSVPAAGLQTCRDNFSLLKYPPTYAKLLAWLCVMPIKPSASIGLAVCDDLNVKRLS